MKPELTAKQLRSSSRERGDKTILALAKYEIARQKLIAVKKARSDLFYSCSEFEKNPWSESCIAKAKKDYESDKGYDGTMGEYICNAGLCDFCERAWLMHGEIQEAKAELAKAKRSISAIGKQAIKELQK